MLWSDTGAFSLRKGDRAMTRKSGNDRHAPTRQEAKLAATDRAAREIIRTEAEARLNLTASLKERRLRKEAEDGHGKGHERAVATSQAD